MVNKSELLKDLKNGLMDEEKVVQVLSNFYQVLNWSSVVKKEHHDSIKKGLIRLREVDEKHVHIIEDMIKYVEDSAKNEF